MHQKLISFRTRGCTPCARGTGLALTFARCRDGGVDRSETASRDITPLRHAVLLGADIRTLRVPVRQTQVRLQVDRVSSHTHSCSTTPSSRCPSPPPPSTAYVRHTRISYRCSCQVPSRTTGDMGSCRQTTLLHVAKRHDSMSPHETGCGAHYRSGRLPTEASGAWLQAPQKSPMTHRCLFPCVVRGTRL